MRRKILNYFLVIILLCTLISNLFASSIKNDFNQKSTISLSTVLGNDFLSFIFNFNNKNVRFENVIDEYIKKSPNKLEIITKIINSIYGDIFLEHLVLNIYKYNLSKDEFRKIIPVFESKNLDLFIKNFDCFKQYMQNNEIERLLQRFCQLDDGFSFINLISDKKLDIDRKILNKIIQNLVNKNNRLILILILENIDKISIDNDIKIIFVKKCIEQKFEDLVDFNIDKFDSSIKTEIKNLIGKTSTLDINIKINKFNDFLHQFSFKNWDMISLDGIKASEKLQNDLNTQEVFSYFTRDEGPFLIDYNAHGMFKIVFSVTSKKTNKKYVLKIPRDFNDERKVQDVKQEWENSKKIDDSRVAFKVYGDAYFGFILGEYVEGLSIRSGNIEDFKKFMYMRGRATGKSMDKNSIVYKLRDLHDQNFLITKEDSICVDIDFTTIKFNDLWREVNDDGVGIRALDDDPAPSSPGYNRHLIHYSYINGFIDGLMHNTNFHMHEKNEILINFTQSLDNFFKPTKNYHPVKYSNKEFLDYKKISNNEFLSISILYDPNDPNSFFKFKIIKIKNKEKWLRQWEGRYLGEEKTTDMVFSKKIEEGKIYPEYMKSILFNVLDDEYYLLTNETKNTSTIVKGRELKNNFNVKIDCDEMIYKVEHAYLSQSSTFGVDVSKFVLPTLTYREILDYLENYDGKRVGIFQILDIFYNYKNQLNIEKIISVIDRVLEKKTLFLDISKYNHMLYSS